MFIAVLQNRAFEKELQYLVDLKFKRQDVTIQQQDEPPEQKQVAKDSLG